MIDSQRDPFKLLADRPVPEPDDTAMRAAIASAREEFARQVHGKTQGPSREWLSRARRRLGAARGRFVPAALVTAAALVVIAVLPGILTPHGGEQSRPRTEMAEMPVDAEQGSAGRRLGAQSVPQAPLDFDNPPKVNLSSLTLFETQELRLGFKIEDDLYQLYMLAGENALPMDRVQLPPRRRVEIVDAFRYPRPLGQPEVIAVETRRFTETPGERSSERRWEAYLLDETGARMDAGLTSVLADVANRAEAERRIAEAVQR